MLLETLALLAYLPLLSNALRPKDAILLSKVQSLTLRGNGAKTTHRRLSPISQLKCISSRDICQLHHIDVMQCTNQGSSYDDSDVEWSCVASLPTELKLGSTDVICEGYSSSQDPYVLRGSCGVEYRLMLTPQGEQRYPELAHSRPFTFGHGHGSPDWSAWLFALVFFSVLAWIVYAACFGSNPTRRQGGWRPGGGGDGWGGGGGGWGPGWGPDGDPPPPYPGSKPQATQRQAWTPGFWSGLAGGAAAGYMAGSRGNRNDDRRQPRFSSNWSAGPSSPRPSPFASSSSGGGSARHESTGFGSTRRR
ncbi:hypothetical protein CDD82_1316 [Ophiocordyceps australis]|uniref:Store-operated calcium entry-associated regulatory factor n=1 Tax=Ophiocordyceps australis TaxID=1399860 RepID=A0A2C5ZMR4_9HYPO|nr:hypothetical protein CDD82_1316 [Ophiocordyceps australis]